MTPVFCAAAAPNAGKMGACVSNEKNLAAIQQMPPGPEKDEALREFKRREAKEQQEEMQRRRWADRQVAGREHQAANSPKSAI